MNLAHLRSRPIIVNDFYDHIIFVFCFTTNRKTMKKKLGYTINQKSRERSGLRTQTEQMRINMFSLYFLHMKRTEIYSKK